MFDLDMTLLDTSALEPLRRARKWGSIKPNVSLVRTFENSGDPPIHQIPGVLKAAGYQVGIVTSSPASYAKTVLGFFNVVHDALVGYHDTIRHKPDPEPLLECMRQLDSSADQSFYVGDEEQDFVASRSANVVSVGVRWGCVTDVTAMSVQPDYWTANTGDFMKLLD
jgi:HAD superfamily hydrolase (TIGR01549 family)